LEGKYPPKSVIPVDVDPVHNPGVFEFKPAVIVD
jgi:ATP-dependent Clp protease ATP-binding subunit ClpB